VAVLADGSDDSGVDLLSGLSHGPTVPSARRRRCRTGDPGPGPEELRPQAAAPTLAR
jgi:hypothetical protein